MPVLILFCLKKFYRTAIIKNKITSLGIGNEPIYGAYLNETAIVDYVTKTAVGRPIGSFFGYVTDGIFQTADEVKASAQYEAGKLDTDQSANPGDFRFKDLNGDGRITAEDRTYLGSPLPDFVFGVPVTSDTKVSSSAPSSRVRPATKYSMLPTTSCTTHLTETYIPTTAASTGAVSRLKTAHGSPQHRRFRA